MYTLTTELKVQATFGPSSSRCHELVTYRNKRNADQMFELFNNLAIDSKDCSGIK